MDILGFRNYSWMAQASYLGLEDVVEGNVAQFLNELKADTYAEDSQFSDTQAEMFVNTKAGYTLAHHQENTPTYPGGESFKPSVRI